jgi:hypothetical protein
MLDANLVDALALYRNTVQLSPNSVPANIAAGTVPDLMGQGEDAREYLKEAIQVADMPEQKAMAQRAMSYAFAGNCKKTGPHFVQLALDAISHLSKISFWFGST